MVKPALKHTLEAILVLIGVVVALAAGLSLRLSRGPIAMPGLRPAMEHALAKQVEGGQARIGDATLVWFPDTKALGVRLKNVLLVDGKGRPVLRAAAVEGAVALDSALLLAPAPGRLTASDFFAAVSVSPEGRYGLGYDTRGAPGKSSGGLDRMFGDLTGAAKHGHPTSFLRDVNLQRGALAFRETAGPVSWKGKIDHVVFHKANGRIVSDCDFVIDDGKLPSTLVVQANAAVGLKDARLTGVMTNLTPARIFPSVGPTRPLSALDAEVQGHGALDYAASKGVTAADVVFTAGSGHLRFGTASQRFDSAQVAGGYDPATGEVRLNQFKVTAERTRLDLQGSMKLIPEQGRDHPAHLAFELKGPDGLVTLAPSAAPQPVQDLYVRGDYAPEAGRLALDEARVLIAGAPVSGKVIFQKGAKDGQAWGIVGNAKIGGSIGPEQLFAFWPEGLGEGARSWLKAALLEGRIHDVKVVANIAPGDMNHRLDNKALRIDFTGEALKLNILGGLAPLSDAVGHGVLQGNRLDITMPTGKMQNVALSEGSVEIPFLAPKGARAVFKVHAIGDASEILQIVDQPNPHLLTGAGFDPARVSGNADVKLEMIRPMLSDVPLEQYSLHYFGQIHNAGLKQAAIGLDLHDATMTVDGNIHGLEVKGDGQAGPYHGGVLFKTFYDGKTPMTVDMDGALAVSGAAVGAKDGGAPFKAHFEVLHNDGTGVIHSRPLEGRVSWTNDRHVLVEGVSQPAGWQQAGVPVSSGVGASFPIKLTLNKAGAGWNGALEADAYSGSVAWVPGDKPHLRYATDLTPDEARRIGLKAGGVFAKTQPVTADVVLDPVGMANYTLGPMTGRIDWVMGPGNTTWRWRATLAPADLQAVGLPGFIMPTAPTPIDASIVATGAGLTGDVTLAGTLFKVVQTNAPGGRTQYAISGNPSDAALERFGLLPQGASNGVAGVTSRFDCDGEGRCTGHMEADLTRMALSIPDTDWRKTAGKPARAYADVTIKADGNLSLDKLAAEGPGLDIQAQGVVSHGRLVSLATRTAKVDGVYDGALQISRDANGTMAIRAGGRFVDVRPILKKLSSRDDNGPGHASGGGGGVASSDDPWRIDGQFSQVRVTDVGVLRDVKVNGSTGHMDVTAATAGGSSLSLKLYPESGGTAFTAHIGDVSQTGEAFFGAMPLKGGTAEATGRLEPDGFDAVVEMQNVRAVRVPAMGQLLTVASLKGLADTMNGDGILFTHVVAPIRVRGSKVYLDDTRASGSALGITAKGVIDLDDASLDLSGALAPAFALNSMMSNVPVLGALLTSHKGEGVLGLTYSAKGPVKTPRVMVNPLSLATPGILRRIFEPQHKPTPADPAH